MVKEDKVFLAELRITSYYSFMLITVKKKIFEAVGNLLSLLYTSPK